MHIRYRALTIAAVLLAVGCRALGDTGESAFGDECISDEAIYGCIDIQGRVSTAGGAPLENIDVGPAAASDLHGLKAKFVNTGADGEYELRLFQLDATAPAQFNLSLKATQRDNSGAEVKSKVMTTQVQVYQVNDFPEPVTVNFVIQ